MVMSKSLSIVIPVYNEERFLEACLLSIEKQTMAPDEVIVVDNNSTDRSVEIARRFAFVRIVTASKQGIVWSRNAGFDAATSDIIARIDADTLLPPGWVARIQRFYQAEKNKNNALTGGGSFYNIHLPRVNGWIQSQLAYRVNRAVVGHYILWGSNMAFTRDMWLKVRDKTCSRDDIHEDLDLSFHLHDAGYGITYRGSLRVGVFLKRVFGDRRQLKMHMRRWPQTLRSHGYRTWWFGTLGNVLLWYIVQPVLFAIEYVASFFGKPLDNKY
jgi:glycosyltransferase involved in cell wall biosynthesis